MSPFRASPGFTEQWQHFGFDISDGVATVRFTRADKLNALTFDVYADLRDLLAELPHRGDVRFVSGLPKTANGKLDRRALRVIEQQGVGA